MIQMLEKEQVKMSKPGYSNIPLEELARLPTFLLPVLSWQWDKAAFYWDQTGRIELHVLDLTTGQVTQVSHGEVPRSIRTGFAWSRDGRSIAFGKDKEGDERHNLFRLDVETGEVTQLTDNPTVQEHALEFSPDDQWLLVNANLEGQMNLFKLHLERHERARLTDHPNPAMGGRWSPDGSQIAYMTNETKNLVNQDVYLCDADGEDRRRLLQVKEGSQESSADWSPDGQTLAITSDASGDNRAGLCDVATGEVRWLTPEGLNEHATKFSPDGRYLVALRNRDSMMRPVVYDVRTGEGRLLLLPPGFTMDANFIGDGTKLFLSYDTDTRRPELLAYDLTDDTWQVLLPAEYGSIAPSLLVEHEYIHYSSSDGLEIPAVLYKPRNVLEEARLPAIVLVHGGPTGQWFRNFNPYAQFLADRGYVLLLPNVRGSTGYGVAFRDMNIKDWGGGDLEDVAAGAEYLRALPYVDPDRIGVFGGSYGGYMTFMAVVKRPELWKAGVAWVGISDLHRLYDSSMEHFKYYLRWLMGDPEEDAELWRDRSAIHFMENLTAKLFIVHGVHDPRCPIAQARIVRDRLLELGKVEGEDFEYVELGEEGHGSSDIEQKIRSYKLLADFMERRL
jgi:dipeptidyl aminopeptidase/acylaminoacyl peptidase